MQQQTTFTNLQNSTDSVKQHATVISYLHKSREAAGTASLYKTLRKNFTASDRIHLFSTHLPLDNRYKRFSKRSVDIVLSLLVIIGILPWLTLVLAILIKAGSKGPVFFCQKRSGRNNGVFTCIKFRTMLINKDADIVPAMDKDSRITRAGQFMRRTFIDELPQFFNVLIGDMSVIGQRTHMLSEHFKFEALIPHYHLRQNVKPGITGLSQVMGLEGAVNTTKRMNDRVIVDNFYIRHWSLKLDLIILLRTACKMFGF
jgi:lipopolysaccharide/colanic/teichoic acid biosynthesis glycosyltransferase